MAGKDKARSLLIDLRDRARAMCARTAEMNRDVRALMAEVGETRDEIRYRVDGAWTNCMCVVGAFNDLIDRYDGKGKGEKD